VAENEKQQRPLRTLTVENFSVIKHAKLEFGKITVLIGPQSSGKSLLCKLAFFFEQHVSELVSSSNGRADYPELSFVFPRRTF
jgi:predicted ATP-dependent endonuclease of OLD family